MNLKFIFLYCILLLLLTTCSAKMDVPHETEEIAFQSGRVRNAIGDTIDG